MNKRSDNAYYIWWVGASNPAGVARSLVEAIDECRSENTDPAGDMYCQMIADHLAFLLRLPQPSMSFNNDAWVDFCRTYEAKNFGLNR
jgi:hypothetical protein